MLFSYLLLFLFTFKNKIRQMDTTKLNVILDLDNTIINSLEPMELKAIDPDFVSLGKTPQPTEFQSKFMFADMHPYFRVFARPGLESFMDYLFEHFNVGVWTAAESEYALFIIRHFIETKPNRKLKFIFYRYHVDAAEQRYGENRIKDLRLLWEHYKLFNVYPCNTILIDDLIDVKNTNPQNVFRLKSFDMMNGAKPNLAAITDRELDNVKDTLEQLRLKYKPNRCTIREKFYPVLSLLQYE